MHLRDRRFAPIGQVHVPFGRQRAAATSWSFGCRRVLQRIQHSQAVALGQAQMLGLFDDLAGRLQGMAQDEIGHVGMLDGHNASASPVVLANAQGKPPVIVHERHQCPKFVDVFRTCDAQGCRRCSRLVASSSRHSIRVRMPLTAVLTVDIHSAHNAKFLPSGLPSRKQL